MLKRTKSEQMLSVLNSLRNEEILSSELDLDMLKHIISYIDNVSFDVDNDDIKKLVKEKEVKEKIHKWIEVEIKEMCIR